MKSIDQITYRIYKAILYVFSSLIVFILRSLYFIVFALIGLFALSKYGVPYTVAFIVVASAIAIIFLLDFLLKLDFFNPKNGLVRTRSLLTSFQSFTRRSLDDQVTDRFQGLERSYEVVKQFEAELEKRGIFDLSTNDKAKEVERILLKILTEIGTKDDQK